MKKGIRKDKLNKTADAMDVDKAAKAVIETYEAFKAAARAAARATEDRSEAWSKYLAAQAKYLDYC